MRLSEDTLALATAWSGRVPELAEDMYREIADRIPVVQADPDLAALTLGSCSSNVEAILSMVRAGIPATAAEAPATALEHARAMAVRGAEVNDTLRFYRLGHGHILRRWALEQRERVDDADRVLASLQELTAFSVEYLDIVSARVSDEHLAERERRQRRAALLRADLVAALLAGDPDDLAAAQRTLGHPLDRAQLAFVCWSTAPAAQLERAAVAVAEALGSARPLLVPDGPRALAGWLVPRGRRGDPAELADVALGRAAPDVLLALGEPGMGLDGFRSSHDQAERARRVADLAADGRRVVTFADVALVDLLSRDVAAARAFVRRELADLAAPDPAVAAVRDTVRAVLAPRGGVAQAARHQHVHRNTVLQRLRRAEVLRGRPIDDRDAELHAALVLARALPGQVLGT